MPRRAEPKLIVLNPTVGAQVQEGRLAPRPDTLRGKTLGVLWNNRGAGGEHILRTVAKHLEEKYGLERVIFRKKVYYSERAPEHILDELATASDVVLAGLGD